MQQIPEIGRALNKLIEYPINGKYFRLVTNIILCQFLTKNALPKSNNCLLSNFILTQFLTLNIASAQWTNRYAKLNDFGHHVYLEQHELPILAHGPTDPAPAPDGKYLAFAARGWIWNLSLDSRTAVRLTNSSGIDSRPKTFRDGSFGTWNPLLYRTIFFSNWWFSNYKYGPLEWLWRSGTNTSWQSMKMKLHFKFRKTN
jgi:hypothetical protein